MSSHPFLCKRIAALRQWRTPGSAAPVRRTVWAYPLAPILGISSGGMSSLALIGIIYFGIFAAIAIPNFKHFTERAKAHVTAPEPEPSADE